MQEYHSYSNLSQKSLPKEMATLYNNSIEDLAFGLIDGLESNNIAEVVQTCIADSSQTLADIEKLINDLKQDWSDILPQLWKILGDLRADVGKCLFAKIPSDVIQLIADGKTLLSKTKAY